MPIPRLSSIIKRTKEPSLRPIMTLHRTIYTIGTSTVKGRVRAFLTANPHMAEQSVNNVVEALHAAGIQAGRTTVAEVLKESKTAELA
jgi:hypothetical protein